jgi:hypothetical protein
MIWGRSTIQWTGLIAAFAAMVQTVAVVLVPDSAAIVAVIMGALVAFLGVLIAFISNDVTPTADPHVPTGTLIKTIDTHGAVVGTTVASPGNDSVSLVDSKSPSNE